MEGLVFGKIRNRLNRYFRKIIAFMPIAAEIRRKKPRRFHLIGARGRFENQIRFVDFDIRPEDRVLDIGSGGNPFPHADVLMDYYPKATPHRTSLLKHDGKPFVVADIHDLPFKENQFDYIYCSHVLEHVENPIRACKELVRVGQKGYIETPTFGKDILFSWGKEMHKWHVVSCGPNLVFFEYTPRQLMGIQSRAWHNVIYSPWYHPLQESFYSNLDLFNVMFEWNIKFNVSVFYLDGSVRFMSDPLD